MPQAQDPIALIGELVKALNLYSNLGVGNHLNVKIALVLLHYFWFVQYAMLHKIIKCQHNKLAQYFHNFLGVNFL